VIPFDNSFAALPPQFFAPQAPEPAPAATLVQFNDELARELGLDPADFDVNILSGAVVPEGATPIATAYAGHQFGGFSPQLGDGRAVLLGEIIGPDGKRRDLQLKGSGRTPFSRGGDGKAVIGPVLREYLVSESMAALGIPTTRALAAVTTGESIRREGLLPGAVLTRVAASHIRVGTFQFHYARRDHKSLQTLLDYTIARHYPAAANAPVPALAFLEQVVARQAELIAQWMLVGFIHGVMNTDNMAVSGETIDYGPCAFMDAYHPETVFSSIDRQGRYAWANQPQIGHWNLAQLGSALLPLIDGDDEAAKDAVKAVLGRFSDLFSAAFHGGFARKLGVEVTDKTLASDLLVFLMEQEIDFTLFFRRLTGFAGDGDTAPLFDLFTNPETLKPWLDRWQQQGVPDVARMRRANPVFIPRNHRMEEMITAAEQGDYGPFRRMLAVFTNPFTEQSGNADLETPPRPEERVQATFCGT